MKYLLLTFLFITLPAPAAISADLSQINDMFERGNYNGVMEHGRADGTALGYSLAARAALMKGAFHEKGEEAVVLLHAALSDIEKSLLLDPSALEARLTAAMAIGFEAKRKTAIGLGKTARRIMEKLAHDYPNSQIAVGALGGWHAEVSAEGFLARMALGGRMRTARKYFEKGVAIGGDDVAFLLEYCKFLARRGPKHYPATIKVVDQIQALTPTDALEKIFQTKAANIKAAIVLKKPKAVRAAIAAASPFPTIKKLKKTQTWKMPDTFPIDKIILADD